MFSVIYLLSTGWRSCSMICHTSAADYTAKPRLTLLQQLTAGRERGGAGNRSNGRVFGLPLGTADRLSVPSGRTTIFSSYPSSSWWSHRTGRGEIENGCVVWFHNVTHFHLLFLALSMAFLSRWRTGLSCTAVLWLGRNYEDFSKAVLLGNKFLG